MFSGSDGLLAGMCDGKIWIDHSTTDHQQNKVFTAELEAKGKVTEPLQSPLSSLLTSLCVSESFLLECPITGGLEALKKGQMAVWVGGSKEAYQEVKPILAASYSSVMYTGGLGSAMIPKVLSNMLCGLQVCAMAEAMMIGETGNISV